VSDPGSLAAAAERVLARFGRIDVLCNNAGVLVNGPLVESSARDWEWLVGVNLLGVAHGVRTFVPHIRAGGEGGHVVNTASIAGLSALPGLGVYTATKHAVVALSEVLREELAPEGIGVSVLCPGGVRTRIHEAARNRPAALGGPDATRPRDPVADAGMDPDAVGRRVLRAIRANELYVLTHPEFRAPFAARAEAILAAYDRSAQERG
jgi:NAD(P)-dependent dehydrogenase (short-subunit alcohol dehydrogenase family)